ncbi:hypothetical protein SBADM41S_06837 [Streptomyces badius]
MWSLPATTTTVSAAAATRATASAPCSTVSRSKTVASFREIFPARVGNLRAVGGD